MTDKKILKRGVMHICKNPEKVTMPYVLVNNAFTSGIEAIIGIQTTTTYIVLKQCYGHIFTVEFPPPPELVNNFVNDGYEIYLYDPCTKSRKIKLSFIKE